MRQAEELLELVPSTTEGADIQILAPAGCNLALFRLTAGDVTGARAAAREILSLVRDQGQEDYWPYSVVALLAAVAAVRGDARTAAKLIGFVNAWHETQEYPPAFAPRATIDLAVDAIRRQLSAPVIESLSAEGARLTLEAALAEASAI
jgi:ATP/maltotriose-dependent transcriptional regulator MalT